MTDEYLRAMQELWTSASPSFSGKYVQFHDLHFEPKPVQRPPADLGGRARQGRPPPRGRAGRRVASDQPLARRAARRRGGAGPA